MQNRRRFNYHALICYKCGRNDRFGLLTEVLVISCRFKSLKAPKKVGSHGRPAIPASLWDQPSLIDEAVVLNLRSGTKAVASLDSPTDTK